MAQTDRLVKIQELFSYKQLVTKQSILSELEISVATFKRDIEKLRNDFNMPIEYDKFENAYKLGIPNAGPRKQLPGLWFSQSELTALVLMQHLLSELDQSKIISPRIAPLSKYIDDLLKNDKVSTQQFRKRIKVIGMSMRKTSLTSFEEVSLGLLKNLKLEISYHVKTRDENTHRIISPQQLIYYRENWYLDAFCHLRNDLRSFALDGILNAKVLPDEPAKEITEATLNEHFAQSYGIFSGKATKQAKLRFTPERARYIKKELWHPKQKLSEDDQGYLTITFDYNQDAELIMDILKHGSHVEVLAPKDLKEKVCTELKKTLKRYQAR